MSDDFHLTASLLSFPFFSSPSSPSSFSSSSLVRFFLKRSQVEMRFCCSHCFKVQYDSLNRMKILTKFTHLDVSIKECNDKITKYRHHCCIMQCAYKHTIDFSNGNIFLNVPKICKILHLSFFLLKKICKYVYNSLFVLNDNFQLK